jgi:REP element-mobilizing transposase RayT
MPNHIHGIIIVGATLAVAQNNRAGASPAPRHYSIQGIQSNVAQNNRAGASPVPTIGQIIGTFKSLCVNKWLIYINENKIDAIGKFWQRNYYEHIIRNENELYAIREYIINNPFKWAEDIENPINLSNLHRTLK